MGTMRAMAEQSPEPSSAVSGTPWQLSARSFTQWRAGDAAAVDDLIRVMTPILWHVVRAYRLGSTVSEDVVQETWMTFMRRHESIQDPQAVASWLMVTARRTAWRTAERERRTVAVQDETLTRALPEEDSAEYEALLDDEAATLWRAVGSLDERCRRLLRVIAFAERPDYASLTRELQMPVGSIGPTRARCLTKLRRTLESGGRR